MKKKILLICFVAALSGGFLSSRAYAQWTTLSSSLPESDVRWVAADSVNPNILYASSQKRLYKTVNNGDSWARIFTLRGSDAEIRWVGIDASTPGKLYLASSSGVWRSNDSGKNWNLFYQGGRGTSKTIFCAAMNPAKEGRLWLGTASGIVVVDDSTGQTLKKAAFPNLAVYSILFHGAGSETILVAAADGIYRSGDDGDRWQRVAVQRDNDEDKANDSLQQLGVEEMVLSPATASLIYHPKSNQMIAAAAGRIYQTAPEELSWRHLGSDTGGMINHLASSGQFFYAATERGVYRWNPERSIFEDISEGLESRQTYKITYDTGRDRLLAATKKGIFEYLSPDAGLQGSSSASENKTQIIGKEPTKLLPAAEDILKIFEGEPSIAQIQKAAIEYAEVHPRKIQEWRRAAQKKAWLPTVSVSQKINRNNNIDLDRGGTADVDRFIEGPEDLSNDWSLGMSWDLGDLLWNDDQTSIDTRSRLMVELRDDVLNEVTHLYYERRRLQVQLAINPAKELRTQLEQQLRLEELVAGIDGLTNGYLSAHLKQK